ncbi:MAG: VanZ family protein, partial [Nitrospiraceae bacterium]
MIDETIHPWRYWTPVAAYAGVIFYLSAQSAVPGPTIWIIELIGDKGVHAIEFGLLGLLCYRAFRFAAGPTAARAAVWRGVVCSTRDGITDEIPHAVVPLRGPRPG